MARKKNTILVKVDPYHPTGVFYRAGFEFGAMPKAYKVTAEQEEAIRNERWLVVVEKADVEAESTVAPPANDSTTTATDTPPTGENSEDGTGDTAAGAPEGTDTASSDDAGKRPFPDGVVDFFDEGEESVIKYDDGSELRGEKGTISPWE